MSRGTKGLDQAEKQTADNGSRQITKAADHADDKTLQARLPPMVGSARKIGATSRPAMPDRIAPKAKATAMMRLTGIPTSRAVCRSCAVACIRMPKRVLVSNQILQQQDHGQRTKMKSWCIEMTTPAKRSGGPRTGEGSDTGSGPQTISAMFSNTMPIAMVVRITRNGGRPRKGNRPAP